MTPTLYTIAAVGATIALWFVYRNSRRLPASGPSLQKAMGKRALQAVAQAQRFNTSLDFSPQSVQKVERLLAVMCQLRAIGKMSDALVQKTSLNYGAYIGEVVRRSRRGEWMRDHPQFGPDCYPLTSGTEQSFPVMWCVKRIENGEEDDVWFKYQALIASQA